MDNIRKSCFSYYFDKNCRGKGENMFETMDIPFINETIDILDIKISTVNIRVLHPYVICIEGRYDCSRIVFKKEFEKCQQCFRCMPIV